MSTGTLKLHRERRPAVEDAYFYRNLYLAKDLRFHLEGRRLVATLRDPWSEESAQSVAEAAGLALAPEANHERGSFVFRIPRESDKSIVEAEQALLAHSLVAGVIPVLVDEEGHVRHFLPDEFVVQFKDGVPEARALQIIAERGSWVVLAQRAPGLYTAGVPDGRGLFATIRDFSDQPEVEFAEPSEFCCDSARGHIPTDPHFVDQWGLHNVGQKINGRCGTKDADIDAPEAWDLVPAAWDPRYARPNVVVAIIDTGAQLDHPDLAGNLLPRPSADSWNFEKSGNNPNPVDDRGHGTAVAGVAVALDNGSGVVGMVPRGWLMPLKVLLECGMNQDRADALHYLAEYSRTHPWLLFVANCSWTVCGDSAVILKYIREVAGRGVLVVCAAGNDGESYPSYPAIYSEVMAVGATGNQDDVAYYSNDGQKVVFAPGGYIKTTCLNSYYCFWEGTSFAAPHVSGLAALIWIRRPSLTAQEVRELIERNCDPIAGGRRRINAQRSVAAA